MCKEYVEIQLSLLKVVECELNDSETLEDAKLKIKSLFCVLNLQRCVEPQQLQLKVEPLSIPTPST
jgi:hypothetical protein